MPPQNHSTLVTFLIRSSVTIHSWNMASVLVVTMGLVHTFSISDLLLLQNSTVFGMISESWLYPTCLFTFPLSLSSYTVTFIKNLPCSGGGVGGFVGGITVRGRDRRLAAWQTKDLIIYKTRNVCLYYRIVIVIDTVEGYQEQSGVGGWIQNKVFYILL